MISGVGWATVVLVTLVVFVAGATNGLAGIGFAVVGTMVLASLFDPATAVVFMIMPILAVNLSLVRELSGDQLRTCSRRFWPLVGAALVGTVLEMAVLGSLPATPVRVGLGLLTLGFVGTTQRRVALPQFPVGWSGPTGHTRPGMAGVGAVSGLLFGGTNVGIQFVAYLRSFDLSHSGRVPGGFGEAGLGTLALVLQGLGHQFRTGWEGSNGRSLG